MAIRVPVQIVEKAIEEMKDGEDKDKLLVLRRRTALRRFVEVDAAVLSRKQISALWKIAKAAKGEQGWKAELEFVHQASRDPSKVMIKTVRDISTLVPKYLADGFIKGWVFERAEHGALTPYLVTNTEYTPPSKYHSESVTITMCYSDVDGKEREKRLYLHFYDLIETYKLINKELAEQRAKELEDAEAEEAEGDDEDEVDEEALAAARKKMEARLKSLRTLPDGVPVDRLLSKEGFYKETEELHKAYGKQVDRFMKLVKMYGSQLKVRGSGQMVHSDEGYYWGYGNQSMLVDGRTSRAIMDTRPFQDANEESHGKKTRRQRSDDDESGEDVGSVEVKDLIKEDFFTQKAHAEARIFDEALGAHGMFSVPLHLELKVFHLEKHSFYKLHVVNMAPYKYRPEMKDMLILPPKLERVANMLMATESDEAEDIVDGKSQGKLITCIGDPGLGKTLLAEVMSEAVGKPLYKIQAGQLGLDPESLEAKLKQLLHRAERWDCVLMIDEANAYIHDRGVDVTQNAIVGVFLRLLEYFRGTIILTTNQTNADGTDVDIDDAILSRSNAVIRFVLPDSKERVRHWNVQKKLLKAEISDEVITTAAKEFRYSGRSIRQLLRLTWGLCKYEKKGEITMDMLREAAEFIPLSRTERKAVVIEAAKAKSDREKASA